MEYSYGLQVVASEYDIDESAKEEWDGFVGILGTPRQMRLTSFPTRHFLGKFQPIVHFLSIINLLDLVF